MDKIPRFYDTAFLILFGFFTFSPVSSYLLINLLQFPIAFPEIFFLLFYFPLKKRLDLRILNTFTFRVSFFVLFSLLCISLVYQRYDLVSILSTFRGYLYLVVAFVIFRRKNYTAIIDIMLISLGSTIGWVILSLIQFNALLIQSTIEGSLAVYGNLVTLSLALIIPIMYSNLRVQNLAIFVGVILSVTSGIRRQILVFLISLTLPSVLRFLKGGASSIKLMILPAVIVVIFIFNYSNISHFFFTVSPEFHKRVFLKSEYLFEGEFSEADKDRSNHFVNFLNSSDSFIFPKGFVSKRTNIDSSVGIYLDFPLLELSYMFGFFFLFWLFGFFLYHLFRKFSQFVFYNCVESGIWFSSGLVLLGLIFLDGSFLHYAYITPFTGLVLAKVTY